MTTQKRTETNFLENISVFVFYIQFKQLLQ